VNGVLALPASVDCYAHQTQWARRRFILRTRARSRRSRFCSRLVRERWARDAAELAQAVVHFSHESERGWAADPAPARGRSGWPAVSPQHLDASAPFISVA